MITIKPGNFISYAVLFAENRTRYTDMCVTGAVEGGLLYIGMIEDKYAGYLCVEKMSGYNMLTHAFTKPEYRQMGVMKALINEAVNRSADRVESVVVEEQDNSDIADHALKSCGFTLYRKRMVYSCAGDDLWEKWDKGMQEHGNALFSTLRRQGYRAVSFADAGNEVLDQIYNSDKTDYHNELNYKMYFDNSGKCMSLKESMAVIKGDKVVSYTIVLRPDSSSAIFRNLSTAKDSIGGGAIFMAIASAVNALKTTGCKKISYSMDISNNSPNKFREKILSPVTTSQKLINNYCRMK